MYPKHFGAALLVVIAGAGRAAANDTLTSLYQTWEANWAAVSDLEIAYDQFQTSDRERPGLVTEIHYTYRWTEGRVYTLEQQPHKAELSKSFSIWTREWRMQWGANGWYKSTGDYGPAATSFAQNLLRPPFRGEPGANDLQGDLSAILQAPTTRMLAGREDVDGRQTVRIESLRDGAVVMRLWLDPERGALPLRWTRLNSNGDDIVTVSLQDVTQCGDTWLPLRIEVEYLRGPQQGVHTTQVARRADGASTLRVNTRNPISAYEVQFRMDATVTNEDTGEVMRVTPQGMLRFAGTPLKLTKSRLARLPLTSSALVVVLIWLGAQRWWLHANSR